MRHEPRHTRETVGSLSTPFSVLGYFGDIATLNTAVSELQAKLYAD